MPTPIRLAVLLSLVVAPHASAQRAPAPRPAAFARVDSAMLDDLRRTNTPGGAIAIVSGDRVVYAKGYGRTAAEAPNARVTPATPFHIASVTKVFTAATLATLAEAGRVDLAAPIDARLGELPAPFRRVTPHQLLSHTAGLTMGPVPAGGADPATALAASIAQLPARAAFLPPGELFSYSNVGYLLAGRVIEVASGRPYAEQVRAALLDPLGMRATTFDSAEAARAGEARGTLDAPSPPFGPESWPFAGLHSNVLDLSRLAVAFLNGGRYGGKRVLSPSVIARVSAPVAPFQSGEGDYGYGVRVYRHRGLGVVEHGGRGLDGFRSLLYLVPSRRVAVVVLANRGGRRPYDVVDAALDALLPGKLEPAAAVPAVVPMDTAEMRRYVGRYASGAAVIDVTVDDGVLTMHQGPAALAVSKRADGRFTAASDDGAGWVAFVPGADGAAKYVHFNMRAYLRR